MSRTPSKLEDALLGKSACGLSSSEEMAAPPSEEMAERPPRPPRGAIERKLAELFGIDLRSLALFRVGLALVLLGDLITRSRDLADHYSDWGVMPRADLLEYFGNQFYWCIHLVSGEAWVQGGLFLFAGFAAVLLLVGYYTRPAAFVSWAMLVSLQNRNPMVGQGGDVLLRLLLFWGLFLPLGARFSIDSALNTARRAPRLWGGGRDPDRRDEYFLSVATFALVIQVCIIYWAGVLLKVPVRWLSGSLDPKEPWNPPAVWSGGEAVRYALHVDIYATQLGIWLRERPAWVLRLLTKTTLVLEAFGPVLALVPVATGPLRLLAVVVMIGMHVNFGAFLELGIFSYAASVAWLALLPAWFWDRLFAFLSTPARTGLRIYWDGECEFCRRMALLIHTFFLLPATRVARAQEDPAILAELQAENSWVVVDYEGNHLHRFEALAYVVGLSPWAWPLAWLLRRGPVMRWGTRAYEAVARDRAKGARFLRFLRPRPLRMRAGRTGAVVAAVALAYVLAWNLREYNFKRYGPHYPKPFNSFAALTRVDQYWGMFAPYPLTADGWFVIPGKLRNGKEVDLLTGRAVTWAKPPLVSATYRNQRWRKYMENLCAPNFASQHLYFGRYLCRWWDQTHAGSHQMATFRVTFMREDTLPDRIAAPRPVTYWNHQCFVPPAPAASAPATRPAGNPATVPAPPAGPGAAATVAPVTTAPADKGETAGSGHAEP